MSIAAQGLAQEAARRQMIQWLIAGMAVGAALFAAGLFAGRLL